MTTLEKIQQMLSEHLGLDIQEITPTSHLIDDLGADDLDIIELIIAIEEDFSIEIEDGDSEAAMTVNDFVTLVDSKTQKG